MFGAVGTAASEAGNDPEYVRTNPQHDSETNVES